VTPRTLRPTRRYREHTAQPPLPPRRAIAQVTWQRHDADLGERAPAECADAEIGPHLRESAPGGSRTRPPQHRVPDLARPASQRRAMNRGRCSASASLGGAVGEFLSQVVVGCFEGEDGADPGEVESVGEEVTDMAEPV
jgi:hypothetical protein